MPIFRVIGALLYQRLVPGHAGGRKGFLHQATGSVYRIAAEVGAIFDEVARPFVLDFFGPSGLVEASSSEAQQKIPQRGGIEYGGIKEGDAVERGQAQ